MKKQFDSAVKSLLLASAISALFTGSVNAITQNITAEFSPDPTNPLRNEFKNTTPESGVCTYHIPARCKELNIFTIRTSDFNALAQGPIYPNPKDPRQGAMWKVPSDFRDVQVVNIETGEAAIVQMRIAGIGHRWDVRPGVAVWQLPGVRWDQQWRHAPSPCEGTGYIAAGSYFALFFWLVPEGAGMCSRQPGMEIAQFWYSNLEYAYALRTPNPLKMVPGRYTGSIKYTIGPGGDFDFGDVMKPSDNHFIFNFELDVTHILKVEIPPGGNRVELVPQGGWRSWLQQGRRPTRLFRDQTFNLWASGQFRMQLQCQYPLGNTCSIQSESGEAVPLNISVSLPGGISDESRGAVSRRPLLLDGSTTRLFSPTHYVDRRPATLHFEVPADAVGDMFKPGAPNKYSGTVTVIWDSEV